MMQMQARSILRSAVVVALAFLATSAHATFHLFTIDQIFSDASGTVQYIRLSTTFPSQQFVVGHSISTSQGASSHSFPFPANLPGDSTGHSFLIATQGFANLCKVKPDYVVPDGFLFLPGGSINYASVDTVTYMALPTDGTHAIDRNGVQVDNSPKNFSGQTGSVNSPPPVKAGPLDVDQSGNVDALTDGLLLLRYLFGLRGPSLIQGAVGVGAAHCTPALVEADIVGAPAGALDIDQDGNVDALTDGLLVLRYLFGLRGASLIQGAVALGAVRDTAPLIEDYIDSLIP